MASSPKMSSRVLSTLNKTDNKSALYTDPSY